MDDAETPYHASPPLRKNIHKDNLPMTKRALRTQSLLALLIAILVVPGSPRAQTPQTTLPNETPAKFEATKDGFDYVRRDVMIPMRDGVKLHTVILVPKGARSAPILLTRTP